MKSLTFTNMEEMLSELNATDRGRYFLCKCPECKQQEAFIYKNNMKFVQCNRENECGERIFFEYKTKEEVDAEKWMEFEQEYPTLTRNQMKDLKIASQLLEHFRLYVVSDELDRGYRGLSRDVTEKFVADLSHRGGEGSPAALFLKYSQSLLGKDYTKNEFMLERNIVMPIVDENGLVERVMLRSSNPNAEPKEIQLIINPSKETKDFFMDLNNDSNVVVITEALFDGMSFQEVWGDVNYMSLTGVTKTRQMMNYFQENRECFEDKRFIIAMDNDEAGKKAEEKFVRFLEKEKIGLNYSIFNYPNIEKITDPNDLLNYDKELFTECFRHALKKQLMNTREQEVAYS